MIDSLLKLTRLSRQDTLQVNRLNMLVDLFTNFSYDSALRFASNAKDLAEKLDYQRGLAKALEYLGSVTEAFNKNRATAVDFYKQAIAIAEKNSLYNDLHVYYSAVLNSYFYLGDFPNAMKIATKGLVSAETQKDRDKVFQYNNLIATIYFRQRNYSEALKYYLQLLQTADRLNDDPERVFVNLGLADVYIAQKDSVKAFSSLFRSLDIAKKIFDKPSHSYRHKIPYILYRIGYAYKTFGNNAEALKYTLDALAYTRKVPCDKFDIANYYLQAGDIYRKLNDYPNAKENLYKGLSIAEEIGHKEDTRDAYGFLSEIFSAEKKFDSAFFFLGLYTNLKDSIVNEVTQRSIAEIQGQYNVAKKDKEIARQHQFRNILIGSFVFLLLILMFLYNRYQLKQKNRYQKELNRQQNELFNAIAAAQDQERKRIAQDIHDSLGSILSAAKLKLSALKENQPLLSNEQIEKYQTTLQLLDEASAELRSISHNIMPATLSKLGLIAALKNLSTTISSHSGLQINFTSHDFMERIPEQTEMSIYRIVLELINNIVKHAQANKVTVQLIKYPDYINLSVEDNGRGFDYRNALQEKKGIGLGNILSRVDYLKGKMNVDSVPGRGTTVIIDIPYMGG
ncbi:MAG TPA: sensor histidine kinase [Chitinophagaceae bacterium]|nr:sensor histidine kinase [Chitinophagaceae bacterium]